MPVGLQIKNGKTILAVVGCLVVWLLYTLIFRQIIRYDNDNIPGKNLNLKQETYEIDQRVSVCFKDVAPFSMLLKQDANVCRNVHDLVIVVHTDPSNFQLRSEFRETLRKVKKEATIYNLQIDTFYMLGLDKDQCISSTLLQEMSQEKDILISSIVDSNKNQTLKSVNTLKWFDENCSNSKLLLKLDAKMNPSTSFSTKQFYKLIQSWRNQNIVLLGSLNMPKLLPKNSPVSHSSLTESSLDPISAQYLHLNYLLSRNVVISLLKARADAINISAWKEDLFVTGVLANVAQIRPKHDERFLRQCAGTLCIFCECFVDLERQIHFSRPYYFAGRLSQSEESALPLKRFIAQTDLTWSTNQYEPTAATDHTLSTSSNEAETSFTELSTLTSTTPSFSEATTILKNEFATLFKSIGEEITTTGSTPTTTNSPDSIAFSRENTETTAEISSQFTKMWYTTTERSLESLESENFIVTATTLDENKHFSSSVTDLTTNIKKSFTLLSDSSHVTETDVTQSLKINPVLDETIRTTPAKTYDFFTSTSDQNMETESASLTDLSADPRTTLHTEPTTPTYFYVTENGLQTTNPQGESFFKGSWSDKEQLNFKQTTTQIAEFQTESTYESLPVHTNATTEALLKTTTAELATVGAEQSHFTLHVTSLESKEQHFPEMKTHIWEELLTEPVLQSTVSNINDITTDLSLTTDFRTETSNTRDTSTAKDILLEGAITTDMKSEISEFSALGTCNPLSSPKETAEFFTIPTQPENLETITSVSDNGYTITDSTKETVLLKESLKNSDRIHETGNTTKIFSYRLDYSSPKLIQDLGNSTGFESNNLKIVSTNSFSNLTDINKSLSFNLTSSYIPTNFSIDSARNALANIFNPKNNRTNFSEKKKLVDLVNNSSSTSSEQNLQSFSNQISYETNGSTRKYAINSKVDGESTLESETDGVYKVTQVPIFTEFEILPSKKDPKVGLIRTTIPRRRVRVRINSSTPKSETSKLKSAPSSSSKTEVRITSSTSMTNRRKQLEHRKLRRKRKMKKIVIRIRKMFMKLPTTRTSGVLKKYPNFIFQ